MKRAKKKDSGTRLECTNCSAFEVPLLACGRCMIVQYCSRNCQKQHWTTGGHSKQCVAVDKRKPEPKDEFIRQPNCGEECVICLCPIETGNCKLPCGHSFHISCIQDLRLYGVSLLCPLCRVDLPESPDKAHVDCYRRYYTMKVAFIKNGTPIDVMEAAELIGDWKKVADQGHPAAQFMVGVIYKRGELVAEDLDASEHWFAKVTSPQSYVNIGGIRMLKNDVEGAVGAYSSALTLQPDNFLAHYGLGLCNLKLNKTRSAATHLYIAISVEPDHANTFFLLGLAHEKNECREGAVAMFRRALHLNKKHVDAVLCLAKCLNKDDATAELSKFLDTNPGNVRATEMLESLA